MKTSIAVIHWAPRILTILAILFISMFALDAFNSGLPIGQEIKGFAIHLIPSLILALMLIIAWKRELIGSFLFIAAGGLAVNWVFQINYHRLHLFWPSVVIVLMINGPFILAGFLFMLSHILKKRELKKLGE